MQLMSLMFALWLVMLSTASASSTESWEDKDTCDPSKGSAMLQVQFAGTSAKKEAVEAPPDAKDYEEAYNHLYNNSGYHSNRELTHEQYMIGQVKLFNDSLAANSPQLHNVTFLGCSHGKGASLLHDLGFETHGVDVASRAVEMANSRNRTCGPGTKPCFMQGSLVKLPFEDSSFDAALSADVLEHIAPEDVPQVVSEVSRVVKHYLFLQIASRREFAGSGEKEGMGNLHLTTKGPRWWTKAFSQGGWKVAKDLSVARKNCDDCEQKDLVDLVRLILQK